MCFDTGSKLVIEEDSTSPANPCHMTVIHIPSSNDVLLEQLADNIHEILDVDFVDETIDTLLEGFP